MNRRLIRTMGTRQDVLALGALLAIWLPGCALNQKTIEDTALARVNREPVTVRQLEQSFQSSHRGHSAFLAGAGAVREFLNKTIDRVLLIQEARRIGLDQDPDIRKAVDTLAAERARDQLYKDEMARAHEVAEAAIQAVYPKVIWQYRMRHILTYVREDTDRALTRIQAGEAFGTVANEVSVSPTAGKGGDLGFVTWGKLDPRLEEELERMKPGEVRGPFETDQGWNILLFEEKEQWGERPELAKLRGRIKMTLSQRAMSRRSQEYYGQLRERWKVQVFDQALTRENLLPEEKQGPDPERAKEIPVARMGDRTVTLADLRKRLNPETGRKLPWPFALKQIRSLLDEAIFAILLEMEALQRGYASRPAIAEEVAKLEDELVLDRLLGTVVFPRVQVTDEEVRAFYEQNPKPFTDPAAVRLGIIVLDPAADAEAVLREAQGGADFAALARRVSKDPVTAGQGGELGWMVQGTGNQALEAVAYSLKVGEFGLAKNEQAAFILKVEDQRPSHVQEFAKVKDKARDLLRKQRQREETQRWIDRLRQASEIVIDDTAIQETVARYEEEVRQKAAKAGGKEKTQE